MPKDGPNKQNDQGYGINNIPIDSQNSQHHIPIEPMIIRYQNEDNDLGNLDLQENGDIYWEKAEKIDIFNGQNKSVFTSTNTSYAAETTFKGSFEGFTWEETNEFWAVYPSAETNAFDGNSVTIEVMDKQVGYFSDAKFPSIAKTTDNNLTFYNVCGGIRFKLTESGVHKITFRGKNNEPIAGVADVTFGDNGKPSISHISDAKTEITLELRYNFAPNTWWYIVCLPTVLKDGYELILEKDSGEIAIKEGFKQVEIKRSIWGELNNVDAGLTYAVPTNEIWYYSYDSEAVTYTFPSGFGANLVSHTFSNGKGVLTFDGPVTILPAHAFYLTGSEADKCGLDMVYEIALPPTLTMISSYAISRLPKLGELSIPEGVEVIEPFSIINCDVLSKVNIPSTATSVGATFQNCPLLSEITVSDDNLCYDSRNNCNAIIQTASNKLIAGCSSTIIPPSVLIIGSNAFNLCEGLEEYSIPEGVTEIQNNAFADCHNLKSITLPSTVTTFGNRAFAICNSLKSIEFPASTATIGESVLSGCTAIEEIFVQAVDPPVIGSMAFNATNDCPIYVLGHRLNAYKTADNWSSYASRIHSMDEIRAVNLGLSVKWADKNIGATRAYEYGDYYAWGEIETKDNYSWDNYKWCEGTKTTLTKYNTNSSYGVIDNKKVLEPEDDVANVELGGGWRMPTDTEWRELIVNCTWTWTTLNEVSGYLITSNVEGFTDNSIFLPAAGYRYNTQLILAGTCGDYWSSSLMAASQGYACNVSFTPEVNKLWHDRSLGESVRPVIE